MTLTNEDLYAISQLLDTKFQSELQPIKEDIRSLKKDVQSLKEDVQSLKEDVQVLKVDVQVLKEDVQALKEDVQVLKVDVQVLKEDVLDLQVRVHALELHIENVTDKNIQLLTENYMPAAIRYETAISQMENMRTDIEIIKKVVTKHSQKIQALG